MQLKVIALANNSLITFWVYCPLWVVQLSLPSLRSLYISGMPYIYTDYEGGDHQNGKLSLRMVVLLQAKVRKCGLNCGL